jgi:hypothetical protein
MSTRTDPVPVTGMSPGRAAGGKATPTEITIYSHSPILYWWPVWLVGFALALATYLDGGRLACVPDGTVAEGNTLVAPAGRQLDQPHERLAANPYLGTIFFLTFLVVFVSSNVQLRGLWEGIAILAIALVVVTICELGLWGSLVDWFRLLHIHINLGGYVFVSACVLAAWLMSVFVFDRRTYAVFSPGQVRIRYAIGQAEKAYDVTNMTLQVLPNVFIRHRLLGLYGAGDLVIRTGGPHSEVLEWPNVMFARSRLRKIQHLLQEREVV